MQFEHPRSLRRRWLSGRELRFQAATGGFATDGRVRRRGRVDPNWRERRNSTLAIGHLDYRAHL